MWVSQILVAPRVVSIGVRVCLLHGRRARWDWDRWSVRRCLLVVWVIGSALLMGHCRIICPSTFRTVGQRVTRGCTYKTSHCSGVHIDHRQLQGIVSWVGEEEERGWRGAEKNRWTENSLKQFGCALFPGVWDLVGILHLWGCSTRPRPYHLADQARNQQGAAVQ